MSAVYLFMQMTALVSFLGFILYKFLTRNFDYWKKRNVPYQKPFPLFGNFLEVITFRATIAQYLTKLYNQFSEPYFGIFILNKPVLVVKHPELIKTILVKDFNYFCDRTSISDERYDSLYSRILLVVNNPEWRIVRTKLTPMFTTRKLKEMLELINIISLEMNAYLMNNINKTSIETKDICAKYTTDVIVSCAFGLEGSCFKNENSPFRLIGKRLYHFSLDMAFRQVSYFMVPELVKVLKFPILKYDIAEFFRGVFWKTINFREQTKVKRNDLIDILIQLKNQKDTNLDFTGDRVVAQAVMFYLAGFETTSSTMAFTLYELALSSKIQHKARKEISEVLLKHGSYTYEAIQDMKYLQMIICETLRKYPALPFLDRMCVKDYKIPNSNLIIEKGTSIFIPIFSLHYDADFHPEPEKYDPERFSEENKENISDFSFLPFGKGPRNCIGERLGLLVAKLGLARILSEYKLEKSIETPVPLEFTTKSLFLASKVGIPIKFRKIVEGDA